MPRGDNTPASGRELPVPIMITQGGINMNEQIKKFAEQAGAEELGAGSDLYGGPFIGAIRMDFLEKFAELIVRECIDCLKPLSRNNSMVGAAQDTIKEHFGVK